MLVHPDPVPARHAQRPGWADETFLDGPDEDVCLHLGRSITRADLRSAVAERRARLVAHGLGEGSCLAVYLPPSLALVATVLAAWSAGAQVLLLDYRLTEVEVARALHRVTPQALVRAHASAPALRGFSEVRDHLEALHGRPAGTEHALLQLSSGSTGPSKLVGRTGSDLVAEVRRYTRVPGMPRREARVVLLSSLVHTYGLVGGLLHGLHAGVEVVVPERMTVAAVMAAVTAGGAPTLLMGVPFHFRLLAAVSVPARPPQLVGAVSAGELMRPDVAAAFESSYGVPLGEIYGMTEVGIIAADLSGSSRPAVGPAVDGMQVCVRAGEVLVARERSPYVGSTEAGRWVDGWLHTRDRGELDPVTGAIRIGGRLDSQVSVGGLKVDLVEVEDTLAGLPGVLDAVVVHDAAIEAYVVLSEGVDAATVEDALAERLAAFKLPRRLRVLPSLPKTVSGKPVRHAATLRSRATAART